MSETKIKTAEPKKKSTTKSKSTTTTKSKQSKAKMVENTVIETKLKSNDIEGEVKRIEERPKAGRRFTKRKQSELSIDLDKTRKVPVVSMASHPVGYQCKLQNIFFKWANQGDEHEMTIEEVLLMNSEHEDYLRAKPLLIVDDEEFIEALGLENLYNLIFEIEDIEKFYSQNISTIENKLDQLPQGTRDSFINRTINSLQDGTLSNMEVLRLLKRKYNLEIDIK